MTAATDRMQRQVVELKKERRNYKVKNEDLQNRVAALNAENTQLRLAVNAARAEFDDEDDNQESACEEEDEADDEHVSESRPLGKSL